MYKEKIISLQALRALAFLGIFLIHAEASISWSALGVSVFFVMSGFLMMYQYSEKNNLGCSFKKNIRFAYEKIKKLYPLHIITMCCAIVLDVLKARQIGGGISFQSAVALLGKIFLNITLLQTWIPDREVNTSLNGVAWYLSVTAFLYFMFPYLKKMILKMDRKKFLACTCGILCIEIFICVPWIYLLGTDSKEYIWFMCFFPIFRLGDFFIGCCMGKLYLERPATTESVSKGTIIEIIATIITILVHVWEKQDHQNIVLKAMHNWTTLYIPLAVIWVYLFARKSGIITKLLCNRVNIFIGNISPYLFLIHRVIIRYTHAGELFLNIEFYGMVKAIIIGIEFVITIVITLLYMKLSKKKIVF